jgi:hypothetical protein
MNRALNNEHFLFTRMSENRTRIKYGDFEIEGSETLLTEAFIKGQLPEIVRTLAEALPKPHQTLDASLLPAAGIPSTNPLPADFQMTTGNIAAKLGCSSASDLIIAAAAHLHFVKGKPLFTRQELLDEMQTATSYYNRNVSKNLTRNLTLCVKGSDLIERSTGTYALTAVAIPKLKEKLT